MEAATTSDPYMIMNSMTQIQPRIQFTKPEWIKIVLFVQHIGHQEYNVNVSGIQTAGGERLMNGRIDQLKNSGAILREKVRAVRAMPELLANSAVFNFMFQWNKISGGVFSGANVHLSNHS